jgi:hypothetical protein
MEYDKPFEKVEFDRRVADVKRRMADRGIDLLVLSGSGQHELADRV